MPSHWNERIVPWILLGLLTGCAPSLSGDVYSRDQARVAQQVRYGVVQGVRPVRIEGTKSGVGAVSGAALGGIAGSSVNAGGHTQAAVGVVGGLAGGLLGSAAEEGLTRQTGQEILVGLDGGGSIAVVQTAPPSGFVPGDRVAVYTAPDGTTRVVR